MICITAPKAEASGEGFATLHHDGRNPAREAEDAKQAEECRQPDRKRRAPVFLAQQDRNRIVQFVQLRHGDVGRSKEACAFGTQPA
jgi:hypothetical protein